MASDYSKLLRGMIRYYPVVLKNFRTYLGNLYIRRIKKSNVVRPYSAVFYATHKCNLDCSYCTQKNPEVFSEELDTARTIEVLHAIRRGVDTILFTGGEPLIRPDIGELVRAARREAKFLDVLLVTNGVLLDQRKEILDHLTGLVVSLDAITPEPNGRLTKSSVVQRVLDNLDMVRSKLPPRAVTISCVLGSGTSARRSGFWSTAPGTAMYFQYNPPRTACTPTSRCSITAATGILWISWCGCAPNERSPSTAPRSFCGLCSSSRIFIVIQRCSRVFIPTATCFTLASRCARSPAMCWKTAASPKFSSGAAVFTAKSRNASRSATCSAMSSRHST